MLMLERDDLYTVKRKFVKTIKRDENNYKKIILTQIKNYLSHYPQTNFRQMLA